MATTLANLAFRNYGSSLLYRRILDANPHLYQYIYTDIPNDVAIEIPPEIQSSTIPTFGDYPWAIKAKQKFREANYPVSDLRTANGEFLESGTENQLTIDSSISNIPIAVPFSFL